MKLGYYSGLAKPGVEKIIGVCRSGALSEMHGLRSPGTPTKLSGWKETFHELALLVVRNRNRVGVRGDGEYWGYLMCVGMFDMSNEIMRKMNGDANKVLLKKSREVGSPYGLH